MYRFLIFYLAVYGGANAYFLHRLFRATSITSPLKATASLLVFLVFIAPLAARRLETSGLELTAELLAQGGYLWMGLLFLFVTAAGLMDIINGAAQLVRYACRLQPAALIGPHPLFLIALAYAACIGISGF